MQANVEFQPAHRGASGPRPVDLDSDAALVMAARQGDTRAFARLVDRFKPGLLAYVRRRSDPDAALDIVQEAFVAAWRALDHYDPDRDFGAWLRVVALNKSRDRARRLAVRRVVYGEAGEGSREALEQVDPAPSGEEALVRAQAQQAVRDAVADLPAALREPLVLTYFDDLSQHDAAERLGLTPKAIETRVRRARLRLADVLAPAAH